MKSNDSTNIVPFKGGDEKAGIVFEKPLMPYVGKQQRTFDLTYLAPLGETFSYQVAEAIALRLASIARPPRKSDPPNGVAAFRRFWEWLIREFKKPSKQASHFIRVREALIVGKCPAFGDWQQVVNRYRSELVDNESIVASSHKRTKNTELDNIRPLLNLIADRGRLPRAKLTSIPNAKKTSTPRKSVAEIPNKQANEKEIEELLRGALDGYIGGDKISQQEKKDCYRALASSGMEVSGTSEEIIQKISVHNDTLLREIRRCAEIDLLEYWEVFCEGKRLIDECDLSFQDEIKPLYDSYLKELGKEGVRARDIGLVHSFTELFLGKRNRLKKENGKLYWGREELAREVVLSRILTFIDCQFGFFPISSHKDIWPPFLTSVARRLSDYEGTHTYEISKYIEVENYALFCAFMILLVDTGLNPSVIHDLPTDCIEDTDIPEIKIIWGWKDRANGQKVESTVRLDDGNAINSLQVIEIVREMTKRLRKLAFEGNAQYEIGCESPEDYRNLFIKRGLRTDEPKHVLISTGLYNVQRESLKRFKNAHDSLSGYDFAPANIRTSIRIRDFVAGDLNADIARVNSAHSSIRITSGYVMRTMSKMAMDQEIRRFQNLFETVMIQDIPGAAEKLGFTTVEYEENLKKAFRTGLGTICQHLKKNVSGEIVDLKEGIDCDGDDCPDCPLMQVVPASSENLIDLVLHSRYLRENSESLKSQNPERWAKVHMKWLALTEAALDRLKSSSYVSRRLLNDAIEKANKFSRLAFLPFE